MDFVHYFNDILKGFIGPWGSPGWWVIGACVVTIFFARWARAIRALLPFVGAFTLIGLALWALTGIGVLTWHVN
jgi:predicted exporter